MNTTEQRPSVSDRLLDAADVGPDAFRDDQARGVVAAAVDPQAGREAFQRGAQRAVLLTENPLTQQ